MCYLCIQQNPFDIKDISKEKLEIKKERAKLIKEILSFYEKEATCDGGKEELVKLKEEQYKLAREF